MIDQVINGGYCIGCGACAALSPERYRIGLNEKGLFQATQVSPQADDHADANVQTVCPFSDAAPDEDELSELFLPNAIHPDKLIGRYIRCYAGRVTSDSIYNRSSSGGIGRWILSALWKQGKVDHVIQVVEADANQSGGILYQFSVCSSENEILNGGKSAYYPVEMSGVIRHIMNHPGRYAITGVPCFIKTIRNISKINPQFADRVRFCVGIVCGHLKSKFYAEMIGWQLGVHPVDLGALDFRVKIPGKKANEKGVSAKATEPGAAWSPPKTVQEIFGTNYGHGYFKYPACDYCDDVLAENADISIGDAWLPEFMEKGTSIVVVRNSEILEMIESGRANLELLLEPIPAEMVAKSQDAGLRHRREGLAYRLYLKKMKSEWIPRKRVNSSKEHLPRRLRLIHQMRMQLAEKSFVHFARSKELNSWSHFHLKMSGLNRSYQKLYVDRVRTSIFYRACKKVWKIIIAFNK